MYSSLVRPARAVRRAVGATWLGRWARLRLEHRRLRPALARQLKPIEYRAPAPAVPRSVLVPLIETSHYQFFQILAVAKALQQRGAEVTVLLCGSALDGCEIKSMRAPTNDPCLRCRFNHAKVTPLFGLPTLSLGDCVDAADSRQIRALAASVARQWPVAYEYHGVDLIPIVNDSVTRHYYGDVPEDRSRELEAARTRYLASAMVSTLAAAKLHERLRPDIVMSHMQSYSEWAPYYEYFRTRGVQFSAINLSAFDFHRITYNDMDHWLSTTRYLRFLERRNHRPLDDAERVALDAVISKRFSGTHALFQAGAWFASGVNVAETLGIDRQKRNILVPSNVFWDKGLNETKCLFGGVVDWVLETIDIVRDQPGIHLYVKPHPAEKYDSSPSAKGIADFIRSRYPRLPGNVSVILPDQRISPYELMPFMDVGVLYNGTLGLEMMLAGIPVIGVSQGPYTGLGLAGEPETLGDYRDMILGRKPVPHPVTQEIELFAYFYFVKAQIPWTLTPRAFGDRFSGYTFESLADLLPGRDKYLDHLCGCILNQGATDPEGWE